MGLRDRALSGLARQLGRPSGLVGRGIARGLNRGNRTIIETAIDAARVGGDSIAADVGFGGGVSLTLLLERTAPNGVVHGIEMAPTMLARARRRFAGPLADGRLQLHEATMQALPLADDSVDAVISVNTIYFVPDLDAAMAELVRVTKPGGRIALGIGDPEAMAKMPFTSHGFTLRPVDEVVGHLTAAGAAFVEDRRVGDNPLSPHVLVATIP